MHSLVVGASRGLGLALTRHLAEVAHRAGGSGVSQGRVLAAARRPVPALGGKCGGDSSCLVNGVLFDDGFTILCRYYFILYLYYIDLYYIDLYSY